MFQTEFAEKFRTDFMFNNFFSENHAICEITWKYVVEPDRPLMTKQLMCIASWVSKATRHTLRICNTYCFTMATMFMQTHPSVTFIHTLSALLACAMHHFYQKFKYLDSQNVFFF